MNQPELSERVLQILSEAARLFAAEGYERTSMRDIAAACGISKALLYHHFTDKDEIYGRIALGFTRELHAFVLPPIDRETEPLLKIRAYMLASAEYFERYRPAWTASTAAYWHDPHLGRQQERTERRDTYEHLLRRLLADAVTAGAMREVDVAMAGRLILSALNWMHRWYRPGGGATAPEIAAQYYDMIFNGLAAAPPPKRSSAKPRTPKPSIASKRPASG